MNTLCPTFTDKIFRCKFIFANFSNQVPGMSLKRNSRLAIYFTLLVFFPVYVNGQLTVTPSQPAPSPFSPENLVKNVFLGDGVEVISVNYNNDLVAMGFFNDALGDIGIERGILMTTGNAITALGPNNAGGAGSGNNNGSDGDLLSLISPTPVNDAAVLTIQFVPAADTLRFKYVFASEEYDEYVCSGFNDVFGFFLSGPGIAGPFSNGGENIALIPGKNIPVAINSVNNGTPGAAGTASNCAAVDPDWTSNSIYYNGNTSPGNVQYDGYTKVLTAEYVVTPCLQYTIKLAIGDGGDSAFDSGVFLEAKSFGTAGLVADAATPTFDDQLSEGCDPGSITFTIAEPAENNFPLVYEILGTATNGVDYSNVPTNLFIPTGQTSITVPIEAYEDFTPEATETIVFVIEIDPCTNDTITLYINDNQLVPPDNLVGASICPGDSVDLNATLPVTLPSSVTFTSDSMINVDNYATITSPIEVLGITPGIIEPGMIASVCIDLFHPWSGDLDIYLVAPNGQFLELTTDNGADGNHYTGTCFTPTGLIHVDSVPPCPGGPPGCPTFNPFPGEWTPEGPWSDLYGAPANGKWILQVSDDSAPPGGTLLGWSITFAPAFDIEYEWSPVNGLECSTCPITEAKPLQTTTYYVTASDSYGCAVVDSVTINVNVSFPAPNVNCSGVTTNSVSFDWNDIPGASGFEVNVGGTGWISADPGPLSHFIDGLGTSDTVSIEVRALGGTCGFGGIGTTTCITTTCPMSISVDQETPVSCFGADDAAFTVTPSDGNPPYSYFINNIPHPDADTSNLKPGIYNVLIMDQDSCIQTRIFNFPEPDSLGIVIEQVDDIVCFGANNGAATISTIGGIGDMSFVWGGITDTDSIVAALSMGTFPVTATDANGCTATSSVTINEPPLFDPSITLDQNVSCGGGLNGGATVIPSGGVSPYTYLWDNGETTASADSLTAVQHFVTVTDNNGCSEILDITPTEPTPVSFTKDSTNVDCFGNSTGIINVNASGGAGNFTYSWNTPLGTNAPTVNNVPQGNYNVTITDMNGCSQQASFNITEPFPVLLSQDSTDALCAGSSDGSVSVSPIGGVLPFSYDWSPNASGVTDSLLSNVMADTYEVTVTDGNGCTALTSILVNEPAALNLSLDSTDVSCNGGDDGTAIPTVLGGRPPYTFAWSNLTADSVATNLTAGNYTVTVSDINGCSIIDNIDINEPPIALSLTMQSTSALCFGANSGSASVLASGGTGPYSYLWNAVGNPQVDSITMLNAQWYTVTVTDARNCEVIDSVEVIEPLALSLQLDSFNISCFGYTNGAASVTPSGGTGPFSYQWNDANNQSDSLATDLGAGIYTVTVTDGNNCINAASIEVLEPAGMTATADSLQADCSGSSTGTAWVTITGGFGPYTYEWSNNGPDNDTLYNVAAGSYSVTVTDVGGCTTSIGIEVTEPTSVLVDSVSVLPVGCTGGNDGMATVFPSGGSGVYSYDWGGGFSTNPTVNNLAAGIYPVTIADENGCSYVQNVEVTEPPEAVIASLSIVNNVTCNGMSDGSLTVFGFGGSPGYSYAWSLDGDSTIISTELTPANLSAGTYRVTITDSRGCSFDDVSISISEPPPIVLSLDSTSSLCYESIDGSLEVMPSGGNGFAISDYIYQWSTFPVPQTGTTAINLQGGQTYQVTVTDLEGCSAVGQATVPHPEPITYQTNSQAAVCFNEENGIVWIDNLNGGNQPYSYALNNGATTASSDSIYNLRAGAYNIIVTDINGCTTERQVVIDQPQDIDIDLTIENVNCKGEETGSISAEAAGGSGDYSILWNTGSTDFSIRDLGIGAYDVTITDSQGCTNVTEAAISEPAESLSGFAVSEDATCNSGADGMIDITVSGGEPPYQYSLDSVRFFDPNIFLGLTADDYTTYIRDNNGCIISTNGVTVGEPDALAITITGEELIHRGDSTLLNIFVNSPSVLTYQWSHIGPSSLSCYDCPNPWAQPNDVTIYEILVTDEFGCTDTAQIKIDIYANRVVYIPSGFSPNGDAYNDVFYVQGPERLMVKTLRIYDRWGELVYEILEVPANNPAFGWDGTFNGKDVNQGTFVYYTEVEFPDGENRILQGAITIIR